MWLAAPRAQVQYLWHTGLVALRHVGSSQTRLEPVCPALAGGFLTTAPPGKSATYSFFKIYLFIYLWLCWVFVSVQGLSLVAASGGHSSSRCAGLSLSRPLLLRSTGSRRAGPVIVAHSTTAPPGKPFSFNLNIISNTHPQVMRFDFTLS